MTAFRKADDIPEPPIGWLFGTARRLLANKHRGHRRYDQLIDRLLDDAGSEADADRGELKQAFMQTLATLSPGRSGRPHFDRLVRPHPDARRPRRSAAPRPPTRSGCTEPASGWLPRWTRPATAATPPPAQFAEALRG